MKRKITTLLLMLALVIASVSPTQKAEAAAKLSKKSVTLTVGKTTTIKLTGGNATWTVKNAKIKILKQTKKSAKIQAMSKGTTYLYAKVGKKKLKCKVTCKVKGNNSDNKETFSASKAKQKITKERFDLNGYIYVKLHSEYNVGCAVKVTCNFCDSNGQILDYEYDTALLEKGRTVYCKFNFSEKKYDKVEISYDYNKTFWQLVASDVSLTHKYIPATGEYDDSYIMTTITNGSKYTINFAEVAFVYYDSNNNIVGIDDELFMSVPSGSSQNEKAYMPRDANYQEIQFDHYKCFVSYAYGY